VASRVKEGRREAKKDSTSLPFKPPWQRGKETTRGKGEWPPKGLQRRGRESTQALGVKVYDEREQKRSAPLFP